METEIIDKLFLELSQVSQATTARELRLLKAMKPFADLVSTTSGRIPYERLSAAHWHELAKEYKLAGGKESEHGK